MWDAIHAEARKYGISVITGHSARYIGCGYPMVGGAAIAVGPYWGLAARFAKSSLNDRGSGRV